MIGDTAIEKVEAARRALDRARMSLRDAELEAELEPTRERALSLVNDAHASLRQGEFARAARLMRQAVGLVDAHTATAEEVDP